MAASARVGICVVGGGRAGMIHARNFAMGQVPGAALVAMAEPVEATRRSAAKEMGLDRVYADYREALESPDVDAVLVATPTKYHSKIVVAAADAGKHVLCEKPMAMSAAECDEMIEAAERASVKLQIGFMRRFDASFVAAKDRIAAGEIGEVVLVKSLTHGPTTPKPWMFDIRKSNGPLAEVNSHDIDTVRWFTGSEFEEVYAIGGNYRSPDAREKFPEFYDNVILSARLRNGMQGSISGAQGVQYGYDARCEVLGEKGLITVGSPAGNTVVTHTIDGMTTPIVRSWMDLFLDAYRAEDEDFVRCIRENCQPRAGGQDGKAAVMVVNAGNQSIVEKRPVRLCS
ncbi:MAG: Gfo/Idh/MocA family oxidoreductase [Planctomycetes bacterium]|nr:Gfo/Idh/MocA family oxidoreductase [Planctomycetota bacterium]